MRRFKPCLAIVFLVTACMLAGCAGSGAGTGETGRAASDLQRLRSSADLTDYLTQLSGVIVRGTGRNAVVRVRGINSVNSGNAPLFILDGYRVGRNYAALYNRVNMREVNNVRVVKGTAANIYGIAGAHGVIIIDTVVPARNPGF